MTHDTDISPELTAALVSRSIRQGRRSLAMRKAGSSIAALALVGALGVGTASLFQRPLDTVAPGTPASQGPTEKPSPADTVAPSPVQSPLPAVRQGTDRAGFEATLHQLLPDAAVLVSDWEFATYSAELDLPTDDGSASAQILLTDTASIRLCDAAFAQPSVSASGVCYVDGTSDDKVGQHSWYYQRDDGAAISLHLSTVTRSGIDGKTITATTTTLPFTQEEVAAFLTDEQWSPFLDEAAAG